MSHHRPFIPLPQWTPTVKHVLRERAKRHTSEDKAKAWSEAADAVRIYSDEMIQRWNTEIDTYLVFAGLFSAILTAFNVQSYLLLQPSPPDPTLAALQQISLQLSSFSSNPPFVNSTQPAFQPSDADTPPVPRSAIWLNILWFSGLILSLASASIGIMVKQWLNEYGSGISSGGTTRETARLRQYRLNGLVYWRVPEIVMAIPILLQVALALFLAGLLVLMFTLHNAVAAVGSTLVGLLAIFTAGTLLLPLVKSSCAYVSPQTLVLSSLCRSMAYAIRSVRYRVFEPLWWLSFRCAERSSGMVQRFFRKAEYVLCRFEGSFPEKGLSWRGREQLIVSNLKDRLDGDLISTAYKATMAPEMLSTAAVCLTDIDTAAAVRCFGRLHQADVQHFGAWDVYHHVAHAADPVVHELWLDCILGACLGTAKGATQDNRRARTMKTLSMYLSKVNMVPNVAHNLAYAEHVLTSLSALVSDSLVSPVSDARAVSTALKHIQGIVVWISDSDAAVNPSLLTYTAVALDRWLQRQLGRPNIVYDDFRRARTVLLRCLDLITRLSAASPSAAKDEYVATQTQLAAGCLFVNVATALSRTGLVNHSPLWASDVRLLARIARDFSSARALQRDPVFPRVLSALEGLLGMLRDTLRNGRRRTWYKEPDIDECEQALKRLKALGFQGEDNRT